VFTQDRDDPDVYHVMCWVGRPDLVPAKIREFSYGGAKPIAVEVEEIK